MQFNDTSSSMTHGLDVRSGNSQAFFFSCYCCFLFVCLLAHGDCSFKLIEKSKLKFHLSGHPFEDWQCTFQIPQSDGAVGGGEEVGAPVPRLL